MSDYLDKYRNRLWKKGTNYTKAITNNNIDFYNRHFHEDESYHVVHRITAPNMESAKEWCRLLSDCFAGKVDLIITQKVSNVSKKHYEITILTRMLAALEKPVGIYFVSENIFTLASYYQHDNHDREFFPSGDWEMLPEDEAEELPLLMGGVEDA